MHNMHTHCDTLPIFFLFLFLSSLSGVEWGLRRRRRRRREKGDRRNKMMNVVAGVKNPNPVVVVVNYASFAMPRRAYLPPSPSLNFLQPLLPPPSPLFLNKLPRSGRLISALAASHQDSKHPEVEMEKEKEKEKDRELELGPAESESESDEAWKQTLESFKEQALKMQSISQDAYEVYSKKAMVILKETSEQLKIQAGKARNDLIVLANELSHEGKGYLSVAAENSPEPLKEIVEVYSSSTDDVNDISKVRDFHVGIPYGFLLSVGGFLSFMLTGSISAIRFGIILGGSLLGLSIWSLKSYNNGQSSALALRGQAAIAAIIFLREIQLLARGASFFTLLTTIISGAAIAFFLYRITLDGRQTGNPDMGYGTEN